MKNRRKSVGRVIFMLLLILIIGALLTYWLTDYFNKTKFIHYPAFAISLPTNYEIHGIDVSHYQDKIDWKRVKAMKDQNVQLQFSFVKATEGVSGIDDKFRKNWFNIKEAGITRGAYHFFIGSKSGKEQAMNFINTVKLSPGDLPPVLDIEQNNGTPPDQLIRNVKEWLRVVEDYYKVRPIIYTYVDFYEKYLSKGFEDYPLWIAHYLQKEKPRIQRKWIFWQHNEKGHVNGINAFVDFNVFNGDSVDFEKLLIQ